MEKSIENIWKEGFQKNDNLTTPKIDKHFNQKSIHIIDKFRRMFRNNLIAVIAGSFTFLIVSFFLHIPVMGVIFFIMLMVLVIINVRLLNDLEKINQGQSSYDYLKAFSQWIKKQIDINKKMATVLYPVLFLSFILGFWFNDAEDIYLGERLLNEILLGFPDTYLVYGVPLIGIVIVVFLMAVLAFFGGRIYLWDLNLIYGRILKKLEELITDIENLNT